jgi:hypothetical protein
MQKFKFLRDPLLFAHDGGEIYSGEYFYSMNKEDMESVIRPGRIIPKYTIVTRCIHPIYKDKFKPDHELLWYFRSKINAERLREIWIGQDQQSFYNTADITITFSR